MYESQSKKHFYWMAMAILKFSAVNIGKTIPSIFTEGDAS